MRMEQIYWICREFYGKERITPKVERTPTNVELFILLHEEKTTQVMVALIPG